jgi:mRNA-degrading endonuclease RelE of RelBE toxin-antitoxin system
LANEVRFKSTALQQLNALPRSLQESAAEIFDLLEMDDLPPGAIVLRGRPDLRRIYLGSSYRIIYSVPTKRVVLILRIGQRTTVYAHLKKLKSQ